MYPSIKNKL